MHLHVRFKYEVNISVPNLQNWAGHRKYNVIFVVTFLGVESFFVVSRDGWRIGQCKLQQEVFVDRRRYDEKPIESFARGTISYRTEHIIFYTERKKRTVLLFEASCCWCWCCSPATTAASSSSESQQQCVSHDARRPPFEWERSRSSTFQHPTARIMGGCALLDKWSFSACEIEG